MRRGPILSVCAFAALTAGAGSCAAGGGSTVSATGKSLTIYASVPRGAAGSGDIADAERLAFEQRGASRIGQFTIKLATADSRRPSENARKAIEDPSTIAYIGELVPGASADSIGITNAQDVLQVGPADTALELTQASRAVPGAPGIYYESQKSYGRTFARVVPTTAQEGKAQAQEMSALQVKTLYLTGDGSAYGAALELALKQAAAAAGISVVASPATADGAFYAGSSAAGAAAAFRSFTATNHAAKLFAPSALAFVLPPMAHTVYVSMPGWLPRDLPATGRRFVSDFQRAFGHPPVPEAIFGYEAVSAVLAVLREAGSSANDRATVVRDFFAIRNRSSALGTYSINTAGDISIAPFVFSRLRDGALLPFRSVQVPG